MVKDIVITRTPLRVSFVGGGTDFKEFFNKHNGIVVSSTINKYIYVTVKKHSKLFNEKFRLNYSSAEIVDSIKKIDNDITRSCLKFLKINTPLYISTISDIPSSSGLGSSSAFTVGLLHALYIFKGKKKVSPKKLAKEACYIETQMLKNPIGYQDQYSSAYGGCNAIIFKKNNKIEVKNLYRFRKKFIKIFDNSFLIWTKIQRDSVLVLSDQVKLINKNINFFHKTKELAYKFYNYIAAKKFHIELIAKLINSSWEIKKNFTKKISNSIINNLYQYALKKGALGGKLLGAGSGGFIFIIIKKKYHKNFLKNFDKNIIVKVKTVFSGSEVIYKY